MTVTDEAKLFAIRTQLLEMRYKLDASINIINYVFEREQPELPVMPIVEHSSGAGPSDTLEIYPGQLPPLPDYTDVDPEEESNLVDEEQECLE